MAEMTGSSPKILHPSVLDDAYESARELQHYLQLFNTVYKTSNFVHKLFYMSAAVICVSFGIFVESTSLRIMYFSLGIGMSSFFVLIYDQAFTIPEDVAGLKREMLLGNILVPNPKTREENKRKIKSIPCIGIKIGSFRVMERDSTPEFIDFSIGKIVDLLLAF